MNRAIWIAKKNHLCHLIKKISDAYGGDDINWLKDYCKEVIVNFAEGDKVDKAIECFESMYVPRRTMEGSKDATQTNNEAADPGFKIQILCPSEYEECKAFWQYAKTLKFADGLIKNANERVGCPLWFLRALQAVGLRKGLPDYQYIVPNGKYHSLWMEFKRRDQRDKKKSPEQDEWIERLMKNGHYACYVYGFDHAIKIYSDYVNNLL